MKNFNPLKSAFTDSSRFASTRRWVGGLAGLSLALLGTGVLNAAEEAPRPNIVLIYADDVGWGDLGCYGSTLIPTPHLDRLAAEGARFTDAYCTAATCTPSRYSLLTGEYAFRNPRAQILAGDAPIVIEPGSPTLPEILRGAGYRTAVIGKWHLGVGDGRVDWNTQIKPGPLEVGFDVSFVIPATNDRVPTVWLDGHHVHNWSAEDDPIRVNYREPVGNLPTGRSHPEKLRYLADRQHSGTIINGISRIGWMDGGQSAWWDDDEMGPEILRRSQSFVRESQEQPFFLFMSMHQNHVPRAPHPDFLGQSETGIRGDDVVELDWIVGEMMATLEALDLRENTLVIFSSDNGPIFLDGYYDGAAEDANGHRASGPFRGGKYHPFEGGTRVPTIVHWPGRVGPAVVSDAILSQVDLLASLAALLDIDLPEGAGVDSENHIDAWLGKTEQGRTQVVQQGAGNVMGLRQGDWKFIPATQWPQWVDRKHNAATNPLSTPLPAAAEPQLFNLAKDPGESTNLAGKYPEKVTAMNTLLETIRTSSE